MSCHQWIKRVISVTDTREEESEGSGMESAGGQSLRRQCRLS